MAAPIVFFDIAGEDEAGLRAFYAEVFDWDSGGKGNFSVDVMSPIEATIRKDPADKLLYIGVPDITATLAAIVVHGGQIDVPRFEVPGTVVLGLFKDPAGNQMGLVELDGDKPKVP